MRSSSRESPPVAKPPASSFLALLRLLELSLPLIFGAVGSMSNRRVLSLLARRLEAVRLAPSTPPVEGVGRLTGVGRGSAAWSARAEDRPASRSPAMAHWAEWRRGMSKAKWPFPKSGGVEGFPDQYVRSIKRRVTKKEHHVGKCDARGRNRLPNPRTRFHPSSLR